MPIPVCYFAEDPDGRWEVIDGLQRVQSIVRFMTGDLRLRGLPVLSELNDLTYREIPSRDQRRLGTRTLRFVVVTEESHPDIKFDVFERLNTGAVKLTVQELRNCIYRGTFNDELRELSNLPSFRTALGRPRDSRMRDEELVLRFLALISDFAGYKPPLSQFLNEYMRRHRNESPAPDLVQMFDETMRAIAAVFDGSGFQALREGTRSGTVNRALYDAVSLSFCFADRELLTTRAEHVRRMHDTLLSDSEFLPLIARATADRRRMHGRVRRYATGLVELGVPVALPHLPDE